MSSAGNKQIYIAFLERLFTRRKRTTYRKEDLQSWDCVIVLIPMYMCTAAVQAENIKNTLEQEMTFFARLIGGFKVADDITPIHIDNYDDK